MKENGLQPIVFEIKKQIHRIEELVKSFEKTRNTHTRDEIHYAIVECIIKLNELRQKTYKLT